MIASWTVSYSACHKVADIRHGAGLHTVTNVKMCTDALRHAGLLKQHLCSGLCNSRSCM